VFDSGAPALSYAEAVALFEAWGFRVEPGPQPEEVTLIIDAPDHRNYSVYPVALLPAVAAVALSVRQRRKEACAHLPATATPRRLRRKAR
jgi:hypothetical protein